MMKKTMYVLLTLMLGLSCALWTGCSDNDDEPGKKPEPDGGDVTKDTVYQVKRIKIDDISLELIYASGKVQTIKTKRGVNVMPDAAVAYNGNKVTVTYSAAGMDRKIEYTLKDGNAQKASVFDMSDPEDPYEEYVYNFTYNAGNGMLEMIADQDYPDEPVYMVTYEGKAKNWKTLASYDFGNIVDCTFGTLKNNCTVDVNNLLCNYFSDGDVVNFAILCQLIPSTENVLTSLSGEILDEEDEPEEMSLSVKAAKMVLDVVTTENNGQISKIELKAGGEVAKTVELGY